MDADVQTCIDGIAPEHRPLFDRVHRPILGAYPEADVVPVYGTSSPRTRTPSAAALSSSMTAPAMSSEGPAERRRPGGAAGRRLDPEGEGT
ncbi:DUF1801 domain-containing protein [Streptomyces sp. NPDC001668]|uniref:DUF1801 domain-containing protein n=1 Tax=unclassified Streptomyces TaxID=2593676 RepID=UPI00367DD041